MNVSAAAAVVLAAALGAPAFAAAQEPVTSFDQLNTRLKPGDTVWVTDAQGREAKGRVLRITPELLDLDGGRPRTFGAADVRSVREAGAQPVGKAALWGTVVGAGAGLAMALGARGEFAGYCTPDDPPGCFPQPGTKPPVDWWSVPFTAGIGAGIGTLVGALMPGKRRDVYVAPPSAAGVPPSAPVSVAPTTAPRTQQPVTSFDQLNTRLKPGDTVWVADAQGRVTKGRVTALSARSMNVQSAGATREFRDDDVRAISVQPNDPLRNGVIVGAVAGAGLGIASCAANPQCINDEGGPAVTVGLGVLGTAAGAGLGALVDAAVKPRRLPVYGAAGVLTARGARLSVAPFLTPRAKGVVVSFAF